MENIMGNGYDFIQHGDDSQGQEEYPLNTFNERIKNMANDLINKLQYTDARVIKTTIESLCVQHFNENSFHPTVCDVLVDKIKQVNSAVDITLDNGVLELRKNPMNPLNNLEVMHALNTLYRNGYPGGKRAVFDNMDLSGYRFGGLDFTGASFRNANLTYADMTNAGMCFCDFRGANFSGADLYNMMGQESDFAGAVFLDATMDNIHLNGSNLTGCDFSRADLTQAVMNNCETDGANFSWAKMEGAVYNFELPEFREDNWDMELG